MNNLDNFSYKRMIPEIIGISILNYFNYRIVIFSYIFPIFIITIISSHILPFFLDSSEKEEDSIKMNNKYIKIIFDLYLFVMSLAGLLLMLYIILTVFSTSIYGYYLSCLSLYSFYNGVTLLLLLFMLFLHCHGYLKPTKNLSITVKSMTILMIIISALMVFYLIYIIFKEYQGVSAYKIGNTIGIIFVLISYCFETIDVKNRIAIKTL